MLSLENIIQQDEINFISYVDDTGIFIQKTKGDRAVSETPGLSKEIMSEVIVFGPKLLRNILDYIIRWYLFSL